MKTFIVGAGFTRSIFPDSPLNSDIIEKLSQIAPEGPCATLARKYNSTDIEIALTKLDVDLTDGSINADLRENLNTLRRNVETELANFFWRFTLTDAELTRRAWLRDSVLGAFDQGDVAISLNYDCVLESSLDLTNKWTPNGGYGHMMSAAFQEGQHSPISVLKIHGSCSFILAPAADNPDIESIGFEVNEHFFPRSGRNRHFRYGAGSGRIFLSAPSYVKIPTLDIFVLMKNALASVAKSNSLVIIGCGIRKEDTFLGLLITSFFHQDNWQNRRMVVIDPQATEIVRRLRLFWGGLVDEKVIPISGSLEETAGELERQLAELA